MLLSFALTPMCAHVVSCAWSPSCSLAWSPATPARAGSYLASSVLPTSNREQSSAARSQGLFLLCGMSSEGLTAEDSVVLGVEVWAGCFVESTAATLEAWIAVIGAADFTGIVFWIDESGAIGVGLMLV